MLETSLLEIAKGIGRMFLNPILYWMIILYMIISYKRIKKERAQFGTKILPFLMEGKHTLSISLIGGLILSLLAVSFGVVITEELTFTLLIVTVVLSITGSAAFLSASYTIGITFIVALLLNFMDVFPNGAHHLQPAHFFGLALIAAVLLIIEAFLLLSRKAPTYPELTKSERGPNWVGEHHLRRLAFVPFFCLFPADFFTMSFPLLPYVELAGESYMLVLFPFFIGYDYKVLAELPHRAGKKLGQAVLILGLIVLCFAIISMYVPIFSIAAIFVAILGKEWILYNHKKRNKYAPSKFHQLDRGVKILAAIPDSPAARLGIEIGETVVKVNDQIVDDSEQFYRALQNSGAFFKLEIRDTAGEIRFVNSALYEKDHHELGIIFIDQPFRHRSESLSLPR